MPQSTLTWLGHGTFLLQSGGGRRILLDAWVEHNPACPAAWKTRALEGLDALLISHGHGDHVHDAVPIADATSARVVAIFEIAHWLLGKGVPEERVVAMNKGGTVDLGGLSATMVRAEHSCGISEGDQILYGGEACGFVLTLEDGRRVYHAGDTAIFGDMRLIADLWHPEVAVLPIGGHFTMDPEQAAYACGLLGVRAVVPGHHATFPALRGTPDDLRRALATRGLHVEVRATEPGGTVAC